MEGNIDLSHPSFPLGTSVVDFSGAGLGEPDPHATLTSSIIGGNGGEATGVAPGVTLSAANVLVGESLNFEGAANAIFTQASNGFDVINMSLSLGTNIDGNSTFTKFLDWVVFTEDVVFTKSAGNEGQNGSSTITTPGDAYNIITVGATGIDDDFDYGNFSRVADLSSEGPTIDLRNKPDLVAPGINIVGANVGGGIGIGSGTSFAAPHVAGAAALLLDFAKKNETTHATDYKVIKSILLNAADRTVKQKDGTQWQPTFPGINPLDDRAGTGQLDVQNAFVNFKPPETVNPLFTDPIAWDLNTIAANDVVDYKITKKLGRNTPLTATIVWEREIMRMSDGDDDFLDDVYNVGNFADLDLFLVDSFGVELDLLDMLGRSSLSASPVDPTEHLYFLLPKTDFYTLRVKNNSDFAESFAFAVRSTPVPEVSSLLSIFAVGGLGLMGLRKKHR